VARNNKDKKLYCNGVSKPTNEPTPMPTLIITMTVPVTEFSSGELLGIIEVDETQTAGWPAKKLLIGSSVYKLTNKWEDRK